MSADPFDRLDGGALVAAATNLPDLRAPAYASATELRDAARLLEWLATELAGQWATEAAVLTRAIARTFARAATDLGRTLHPGDMPTLRKRAAELVADNAALRAEIAFERLWIGEPLP